MTKQYPQHNRTFSAAARAEVAAIATQTNKILAERPQVKGVTIDGPGSKDLDDAFWLEEIAPGAYRLDLSIADVGALITPEITPALEQAAFARAFTRYFAEGNAPMLPRAISEDALSLAEGCPRPTITLSLPFDARYHPDEPRLALTALKSLRRLSYVQVEEALAEKEQSEIAAMLRRARDLAYLLWQRRRAQGALALYHLTEGWTTTEEGLLQPLARGERAEAHIIIQEFMILANQLFAAFLARRDVPALYRNHQARATAPERQTFAQMLSAALADPHQVNPERLNAAVELTLERARYAPTVCGHFGLNLPVYIHMTSPLRRYPDLLNQRILHAVLQDAPLPYTKAQLETIAAHINRAEEQMKEARARAFLLAYEQNLQRAVGETTHTGNPAVLANLDAQHFHSLLRMAAEGHALHPAVERELFRRLEAHLLDAYDVFTLVFRFQNEGDTWQRVKTAAVRELVHRPQDAISMLVTGQQALLWGAPNYEVKQQERAPVPLWKARLSVMRAGQRYTSGWHRATKKEQARQLAAIEVLAKLAGVEVPELSSLHPTPAFIADRQTQTVPGSNYKGRLQEALQARGWSSPTYEEREKSGPAHAPTFTVEASVTIEETTYTVQGSGKSKSQAQQNAAERLLRLIPWPPMEPAQTDPAEKSAVSLLYELRHRLVLRDVTYNYEAHGPAHKPTFYCTCTATMAEGTSLTGTGRGTTKKEAAQEAAAQIVAALAPSSLNGDGK
jgi:ribonuclease R